MVGTLINYGRDVVWRHLVLARLRPPRTSPTYYLDCRLPWNRYFTLTLRLFAEDPAGVDVRVVPRHIIGPATYAQYMDRYAKLAFRLERVRFVSETPSNVANRVLVYDDDRSDLLELPWAKRIRLRYDVSVPRAGLGDWLMAPYPMHPGRYFNGDEQRLAALRMRPRTIPILFAGNVEPATYAAPAIAALCRRIGQKNRHELFLELLAAGLPVTRIRNVAELDALLGGRRTAAIVVATPDVCGIPGDRWLDALAAADFFVAATGALMPVCHNAIEAMAVGAIPILMYPEWLHPPLEDGVNCLVLRHGQNVRSLLQAALAMDPAGVQRMRSAVIDYYERHLSPAAFLSTLREHRGHDVTVFLNFELPGEMDKVTPDSVAISPTDGSSAPAF